MEIEDKLILDACCGGKMMWFNKNHPRTIYIDKREGNFPLDNWKKFSIKPDFIMDFRALEFSDKSFKLVFFDPPHLSKLGKTAKFRKQFGCLEPETWQFDLRKGFDECWRVLEDHGILLLKWNDYEIPIKKLLNIMGKKPLIYHRFSGRGKSETYWFCFMKFPENEQSGGV